MQLSERRGDFSVRNPTLVDLLYGFVKDCRNRDLCDKTKWGWAPGFVNWIRAIREASQTVSNAIPIAKLSKPLEPPQMSTESDACRSGKEIASPLLFFRRKAAKSVKKRKQKRLQEHTAQQFDPFRAGRDTSESLCDSPRAWRLCVEKRGARSNLPDAFSAPRANRIFHRLLRGPHEFEETFASLRDV